MAKAKSFTFDPVISTDQEQILTTQTPAANPATPKASPDKSVLRSSNGNVAGFRWPDDSERLAIIGRTGTGKTVAGAHQLSMRSFDLMPWVIIDTKRDRLINSIEGLQECSFRKVPTDPGLYILRGGPSDADAIDDFLLQVWEQENVGIYVDEGYNIPQRENWELLLTQGRSKRIPMIILTQRPKWMSKFTWSEADFFQWFWLNHIDDRKTIRGYLPETPDVINTRLPSFWSYWYDVKLDKIFTLKPSPTETAILATFKARLTPKPDEPLPAEINVDTKPRYNIL